jgi:carbamoyltransferase
MIILGIGGMLTEPAAAILKDGALVGAVEERKLARRIRPGELPEESIATCMALAGARPEDVDAIAIVHPFAAGPETALHLALRERFPNSRVVLVDHHTAHAASAYYPSPFDEATVLTLDRAGDFRCGALWHACATQISLDRELYYPDSLGDLYRRATELVGFDPNADPHKLQWLSTGGTGRFAALFSEVLGPREGNWPRIDRSFLDSDRMGRGGFSAKFYERLGLADGAPVPDAMRADIAAGVQRAIEKAVIEMAGSGRNLCLAGGLALNTLLVARLERSENWEHVFVQPAAGNAGTALGAVYFAWHNVMQKAERFGMGDFCLGPAFGPEDVKKVLENCKLRFRYLLTSDELISTAVRELNDSKIVAWMQGRMEFGPRALGNRSILASPLNPYSTENLNIYIKRRELFRKFAASVPAEVASEYFEVGPNARFLATVGRVRSAHRKTFEAAVLGSDIVRVHTVTESDNPLFWSLLHAAGKATGLPVLYNTSFNLFGDPLVCTPRDAVRSFYSSGIDSMFVGNFLLQK